jgi:hypothetical protein
MKWLQQNRNALNSVKLIYLACICLFIIQGCSTSYQHEGFTGGFSETQIDENVFRVTFSGNGYTSREKASDLALLRSADITLLKRCSYFIIVDSNYNSSVSTYTTPSTTNTTGTINGSTYNGTSTTYGGNTYVIQKPSNTNTIVMFKEKPSIQGIIYNADFICNSLGNKYSVTCESKQVIEKTSKGY